VGEKGPEIREAPNKSEQPVRTVPQETKQQLGKTAVKGTKR
jgi:hypothetical protein